MKILVAGCAALCAFVGMAILAIVILAHTAFTYVTTAVDSIHSIRIEVFRGTERIVDHRVAAFSGLTQSFSGGWQVASPGYTAQVHSEETYQVKKDAKGQYLVAMHMVLQENDHQVITDTVLPVWDHEPPAVRRIKLPDGSSAVAFLTER